MLKDSNHTNGDKNSIIWVTVGPLCCIFENSMTFVYQQYCNKKVYINIIHIHTIYM